MSFLTFYQQPNKTNNKTITTQPTHNKFIYIKLTKQKQQVAGHKIKIIINKVFVSKNFMIQKHGTTKPGTPSVVPSKTIITSWLKSLFPDMPMSCKIQDFGDGVVYCRLLNHFYANPPHSKITWSPKNEYQYANNLKHAQTALLQLGITIPFDVNRVCKRKFLENWALINSFYKHFTSQEESVMHDDNSASSHGLQGNAFLHTIPYPTHQAPHNITSQPSKGLKRPQSLTPHDPELERPQRPPSAQSHFVNHMNPQAQSMVWNNLPVNFSSMTHNPLQMTQYLKQNVNIYNNSPGKGKWSVGSQMFQNNNNAVIDRVKQILLKGLNDTEKVRQIKMLLGLPIDEEQVIKIEDDNVGGPIIVCNHKQQKSEPKQEVKPQPQQQPQPQPQLQQIETKQVKQCKQLQQMLQKEYSNSKEHKISVSKSARKPFKI